MPPSAMFPEDPSVGLPFMLEPLKLSFSRPIHEVDLKWVSLVFTLERRAAELYTRSWLNSASVAHLAICMCWILE